MARLPASKRTSPNIFLRSSASRAGISTSSAERQSGGREAIVCFSSSIGISGTLLADIFAPLCRKSFRIAALEFQTDARSREVGPQRSVDELRQAVKNHSFNAHMIVEIFKVLERRYGAGDVRVQCRCSVPGKRNVVRLAERSDLQKSCHTTAARKVGLLNVNRSSGKHVAEIK